MSSIRGEAVTPTWCSVGAVRAGAPAILPRTRSSAATGAVRELQPVQPAVRRHRVVVAGGLRPVGLGDEQGGVPVLRLAHRGEQVLEAGMRAVLRVGDVRAAPVTAAERRGL